MDKLKRTNFKPYMINMFGDGGGVEINTPNNNQANVYDASQYNWSGTQPEGVSGYSANRLQGNNDVTYGMQEDPNQFATTEQKMDFDASNNIGSKSNNLNKTASYISTGANIATQAIDASYDDNQAKYNLGNKNNIVDTGTSMVASYLGPVGMAFNAVKDLGKSTAGKFRTADEYGLTEDSSVAASVIQNAFDPASNLFNTAFNKEFNKEATAGEKAINWLTGGLSPVNDRVDKRLAKDRRNEARAMEDYNNRLENYTERQNMKQSVINPYLAQQAAYNDMTAAGTRNTLGIMAMGGYTSGSQRNNETVTNINEGGLHEHNILGGVPMGSDNNGTPNAVEEGEVKVDFGNGQQYIFSNRLS